jgi:hypothetical protein
MQCSYINANVYCQDRATDGDYCYAHAIALLEEDRGPLRGRQSVTSARSDATRWNALERAGNVEKKSGEQPCCQGANPPPSVVPMFHRVLGDKAPSGCHINVGAEATPTRPMLPHRRNASLPGVNGL